jgi:hypothetical protein
VNNANRVVDTTSPNYLVIGGHLHYNLTIPTRSFSLQLPCLRAPLKGTRRAGIEKKVLCKIFRGECFSWVLNRPIAVRLLPTQLSEYPVFVFLRALSFLLCALKVKHSREHLELKLLRQRS